jgi:hypothetical protein
MKLRVEISDENGRIYRGEALLVETSRTKRQDKKPTDGDSEDDGSLPSRIAALRDRGFFSSPKTSTEVHQEIKKKYYCEPGRVAVALTRLNKRKELRKGSRLVDGRTVVAYAW